MELMQEMRDRLVADFGFSRSQSLDRRQRVVAGELIQRRLDDERRAEER
jgi:hypothetical protein